MDSILENIKRIRKQKGYNPEYAAHELDISQVAYSKIEKMETRLTLQRLFKLADIFKVEVADSCGSWGI